MSVIARLLRTVSLRLVEVGYRKDTSVKLASTLIEKSEAELRTGKFSQRFLCTYVPFHDVTYIYFVMKGEGYAYASQIEYSK